MAPWPDSGKRVWLCTAFMFFAQRKEMSGFVYVRLCDVREHFKVKLANYEGRLVH